MFYYNQEDYPSIPYPYKNNGKTIKTSGCGPCVACIVFNTLAGKELYTVAQMAKISLDCGARDNSGTNMETLLDTLCKKNKEYKYTTTNDESKVVAHIKSGGIAIINQGDAYNVFSTAGHYVAGYKMSGDNIEVLDPQMYTGKYDQYSRPQRIVKKTADGCIVSPKEMGKATADRSPAYFLVSYENPKENKTVKYKYFTPNATMKSASTVYADSTRKTATGSVSKSERVKVLFTGETNSFIQYAITDTAYKIGIVYTKDIKKDK